MTFQRIFSILVNLARSKRSLTIKLFNFIPDPYENDANINVSFTDWSGKSNLHLN